MSGARVITLFGNLDSGNCHKVQLVLAMAGIGFRRVDVSQPRGEPDRGEFLALNPMGKVPLLLLPGGDVLSESGAILYHYGAQAGLWPTTRRASGWQHAARGWAHWRLTRVAQ